MEESPTIIRENDREKDLELLKNGWVAMYLRLLGDEEGEYELPCRFVIDRSLGVRCKAGDLEIFSQSSYDIYTWMPPGVGYPETVDTWFSKNAVKAGEIGGRLRRYRIGDLFVIELRVHNVLLLEVWKGGERLFTRTIWLRESDASNGAIVAHLLKDYLPIDQAIDVATVIFCSGECNREWLKQSIRVELTLENLEFPDTPLTVAVRFDTAVEKAEGLDGHIKVLRGSDGEAISIPVACSTYKIWLEGRRYGLALLCTANKPSRSPQKSAVAEVGGIYLTTEPLRMSAYIEDGELKCLDVGDKCLPVIGRLIDEEGLAVERGFEIARLALVESQSYRAYYLDAMHLLTRLLLVEAGGKTLKIAARNIYEVRDVAYRHYGELVDAVKQVLRYVKEA